ncbi:MAG: preprotein translocase subunit SecA, partial [Pirellulaceae bacterium]
TAENLDVTPQTIPLASITRQRFFRYYEHLSGMTGTASECEKEFAKVYGLAVEVISPRLESRRTFKHEVLAESEADKCKRIASYAADVHLAGQPVLIGTLDIAQSRRVAEQLDKLGLRHQLLNGVQDADEADIVAQAGITGAITVATNMAGRGTDIQLDDIAKAKGGLHVLVAQRHLIARVDRQLVGRCARCGDPGCVTFFLSPEDKLPATIAPWIAKAIRRHLQNKQDNLAAIEQQLLQAQRSQQRLATATRLQMLRSDRELELLIQQHNDPSAPADCWQL